LLNSNISPTCPYNMVNFGPLAAEISSGVWRTPANFNGFRVLALGSVTTRHSSSGRQPNFAALNRGRHMYSAGRPSRWALAHILVELCSLALTVEAIHKAKRVKTRCYQEGIGQIEPRFQREGVVPREHFFFGFYKTRHILLSDSANCTAPCYVPSF